MKKKEQYISPKITLMEIENEGYLLAATPGGMGYNSIIFDEESQENEGGPNVSSGIYDGEDVP